MLLQRLNQLSRWLPAAGRCDPVAVHRARVASRRLREVLPVVAPGKRGRALVKAARGVTRALGPVRELDVTLTTLTECAAAVELSRDSVARVSWAVEEERRNRCEDVLRRLERRDVRRLGARVLEAMGERPAREAARALLVDADLRGGRRAMQLRAAIESAAGLYVPERLHAVRVGVKKLRYAVELGQQLRKARRTARVAPASSAITAEAGRLRTLRRVQKRLGRMHDLEALIAHTRALQGTAAIAGLHVSADLDRLVRRLENECRDLHGKYMASRGELLVVCDRSESVAERRRVSREGSA
jgi:CHAD domain-containing protein